jgi:catechol 2,3-dioxygenase-like lactoylglutathione lyase family enzyme
VSDAAASRDWYMTVLGFEPVLDLEDELGVVGVVMRNRQGLTVGLHQDPSRAAALRDFAILGLTLPDRDRLNEWSTALDDVGIAHGQLQEGHLGWYMDLPDPDGILIRFHTGKGPDAEEA